MGFQPVGYQQLSSTAGTTGTGLTIPAGGARAIIQVLTGNVRWRDDGTAPTTAVGMRVVAADPPFNYYGKMSALRFVPETTTTAEINVSYYSQDAIST